MKKSEKKQAGKGTLGKEILRFLTKKNSASLKELIDLAGGKGRRSAVIYNIKKLHNNKVIHSSLKGPGLKDEEIYYSIAPGNYPKDIHKLIKIIDDMCDEKSKTAATSYETFFNLCVEKEVPRDDAIKLTHALISRLHPRLKYAVVFGLTYDIYEKIPNPFAGSEGEPDTIKSPTYYENGECHPPLKNYAYFIKLLNIPNNIPSFPAP